MSDALSSGSELGRYRIDAPLGISPTGRLYRAVESSSGRQVALEVIAPRLAKDDRFRRRFHRDLGVAAALDHPHVAPVIETGETARPGDDEPMMWVAREPLDGTDLGSLIEREGALEPPRAARLVAQVGSALEAAHRRGLLHRGLEPGSVLVKDDAGVERAYLTGFGLVDDGAAGGVSDIRESPYPPPPEYVAPEQIKGELVDRQADIYALGGILYCALSGHPPVSEGGTKEKLEAHLKGAVRESSGTANGVPQELAEVVQKALAKTPQERYSSAGELVGELSKVTGEEREPMAAAAASGARSEPGSGRPADKQRVIRAWRDSVMSGGRMWSPSSAGPRGPAAASAAAPPPDPRAESEDAGTAGDRETARTPSGSNADKQAGTGAGRAASPAHPDKGKAAAARSPDKSTEPPDSPTGKPAAASAVPAGGSPPQGGKGPAGFADNDTDQDLAGKGGGSPATADEPGAQPRKTPKEVPFVQPPKQKPTRRRASPAVIAAVCLIALGAAAAVLAGSGTFSDDSGSEDKAAAPGERAGEPKPPADARPAAPEEDRGADAREGDRAGGEAKPKRSAKLIAWPNRAAYTAVIYVSPTNRGEATARARAAARKGFRAGVLRSDGYRTIVGGYWVAFAGVHRSASEAQAGVGRLRARKVASSPYVRLISK